MWKIHIKGDAKTEWPDIHKLEGVYCEENFADYFDDDLPFKDDIKEGYMEFRVQDGKLMTVTIYTSTRKLTDEELAVLVDYTQGQWSDGIGEGFEQFACEYSEKGEEIYVSAWHKDQVISTLQDQVLQY